MKALLILCRFRFDSGTSTRIPGSCIQPSVADADTSSCTGKFAGDTCEVRRPRVDQIQLDHCPSFFASCCFALLCLLRLAHVALFEASFTFSFAASAPEDPCSDTHFQSSHPEEWKGFVSALANSRYHAPLAFWGNRQYTLAPWRRFSSAEHAVMRAYICSLEFTA